jgi:amino acid transporter
MKNVEFVISILAAIAIAFAIAFWGPGATQLDKVKIAVSYGGLILIFLSGFLVLAGIASGKIDISKLLEEQGGGASMSRFQLLVFTLVIGISLFLMVVGQAKFPDVPANVLALLGISATTYGVGKGIQASSGQLAGKGQPKTDAAPPPGEPGGEKSQAAGAR